MAGHYGRIAPSNYGKKVSYKDSIEITLRTTVPKSYLQRLQDLGKKRKYTVSSLIEIAIHNELTREEEGFQLDTSWPNDVPFVLGQYAKEANQLLQFLVNFGRKGATLETLIFHREAYGVKDVQTVSLAIRELDIAGQIEAHKPRHQALTPDDGMCYRVKSDWGKVKDVQFSDKGPLDDE